MSYECCVRPQNSEPPPHYSVVTLLNAATEKIVTSDIELLAAYKKHKARKLRNCEVSVSLVVLK